MLYTLRSLDSQEEITVTVDQGIDLVNYNNCCEGFTPYTRSDWLEGLQGLYIITAIS